MLLFFDKTKPFYLNEKHISSFCEGCWPVTYLSDFLTWQAKQTEHDTEVTIWTLDNNKRQT